jgi:HlyD family secretion protein
MNASTTPPTGNSNPTGSNSQAYVPQIARHRKGELIFSEGSTGQTAYIVRSGEVNVVKHAGAQGQVVLKTLGAGELFGEMALITSNPRSASVLAGTDVELEVLDRQTFGNKVRIDPEFSVQMVRRLAAMVPDTQARLLQHFEQTSATQQAAISVKPKSWWERWSGLGHEGEDSLAAGFEPAHVRIEQDQSDKLLTLGAGVAAALVLGSVVASFFIEVDQIATTTGRLVTVKPPMSVQTFDAGVVREVKVREGDAVKKGQVLLTLDPTATGVDLSTARQHWSAAKAQLERAQAELQGRSTFPSSGILAEDMQQRSLLAARQQQHQATMAGFDADLVSLRRQLKSREEELVSVRQQLELSMQTARTRKEQYDKEREAYQREGVYRLQYLDALRSQNAAERDVANLAGQAESLVAQVRARESQRDAYLSDWRVKLQQEILTSTREHVRLGELLKKLDRSHNLMLITAPDDGVVLSLKAKLPGTVVRGADTLVDIVAKDSELEVEVDVLARDIAYVKAGRSTEVKLDALPFVRHGAVQGEVRLVSEGTFEHTLTNTPGPVYRARIKLGNNGLHDTPHGFRLVPGMTVSADIKAGRRPLSAVVFYPVAKAVGSSMREP